jgi:hypothetical protein
MEWAHGELATAERRLEEMIAVSDTIRGYVGQLISAGTVPVGAFLPTLDGAAVVSRSYAREGHLLTLQKAVVGLGEWVSTVWLLLAFQTIPMTAALAPANVGGLVLAGLLSLAVTFGLFSTAYAAGTFYVAGRYAASAVAAASTMFISVAIGVARDILILSPAASDGDGTFAVSMALGLCLAFFALVVEWRSAQRRSDRAVGELLDHQLDTAVRAERTAEHAVARVRVTIATYVDIASTLAARLLADRQQELATRQLAMKYQRALLALLADRVSRDVYEDATLRDALVRANAWATGPVDALTSTDGVHPGRDDETEDLAFRPARPSALRVNGSAGAELPWS